MNYGLVVGVDKGGTGIDANGATIARLMSSVLRTYGWGKKDYKVLTNKQATKDNVVAEIDKIKLNATESDKVVIAFFCHGSMTGMRISDVMLPHRYLRDWTADLQSKHQLFIIAHCNSGGAVDEGIDGVTLAAPNRIVVTSCSEHSVDPCTHRYTRWSEKFLMDALDKQLADFDNDGAISIQDAIEYTRLNTGVWGSLGGPVSDNYGEEYYL